MVPVRQVCKWCGKTYSVKERLKGQEISEGNFVDFNSLKKTKRNVFWPRGQKISKAIYGDLNSTKN